MSPSQSVYRVFFGLKDDPFSLSPDPNFLYRSEQHEEALSNLIYGVQGRKGFIVLTGEVGTGKTTMLECLRDYLGRQRVEFAVVFNSRISSAEFLEMVAWDFDLQCNRKSKPEVLAALNDMLLTQAEKGSTAVLIVDEAHNLEWEVLEEIRLLGNLENRRGKLLQVILAGQPEFDRKLDAPNLRNLKQRIVLRYNLSPFNEQDTAQYIDSRFATAGLPDQTAIPPDLVSEIHRRSQGIPRLINAICDNLLLTSFADASKVATLEMLNEVTNDMRLDWGERRRMGHLTRFPEGASEGSTVFGS